MFLPSYFSIFLCVMTCLSLTLCKNLLKPSKKCFSSQDGWEKSSYPGISAEGYRWKHEMQVASKKSYWKTSVPNICNILPLKKIFFQNLTDAFFKYLWSILKLVSAIFYQTFIFSPRNSPSKLRKMFFISPKKLFSFSRYLYFCNFSSFFPHFPDSKVQMEVE